LIPDKHLFPNFTQLDNSEFHFLLNNMCDISLLSQGMRACVRRNSKARLRPMLNLIRDKGLRFFTQLDKSEFHVLINGK